MNVDPAASVILSGSKPTACIKAALKLDDADTEDAAAELALLPAAVAEVLAADADPAAAVADPPAALAEPAERLA